MEQDIAYMEHLAFELESSLTDCTDSVGRALDVPNWSGEFENETEWSCAQVDGLELNLSRPYETGVLESWDETVPSGCNFGFSIQVSEEHPLAKNPERFALETVPALAQRLADRLGVAIHYHRSWRRGGENIRRSTSFRPKLPPDH